MTLYRAVPHNVYEGEGGAKLCYDPHSLQLVELADAHIALLGKFSERARVPGAVAAELSYLGDLTEALGDLVTLGLLVERLPPQPMQAFALRPSVTQFRIVLTERCNLRCAECFVTKNADSLKHMEADTLERVVNETIPYGEHVSLVYHFFGGEPTVRFDHMKRAVEIIDAAVAEGRMLQPLYTITTNATLITDEIVEFFRVNKFRVGVSVDGPEAVNDKLRIYIDGRGSHADVKRNYHKMVAAGIDCHVLITPNPQFLDTLPQIFSAVLDEFPMKTITVNTPFNYDDLGWSVDGTRYASLLLKLIRIAKGRGIEVDSAASPPLAALAHHITREGPCALECDHVMASIGVNGTMSYCAEKWHPAITVPMDAKTRLATPIRRATDCLTCPALAICGGPCPAHQQIANKPGELDGNKCDFMVGLLEGVAKNLDLFETPAEV